MNQAAQTLGRQAKGVPKNFTKAELARRKQRLALARAKRWPVLVCSHAEKPVNHIYAGKDFHGNRLCCCGGRFLEVES